MLFSRWLRQHDTFIIWQNGITSSNFLFHSRRVFLPHSNSVFSVIRCNWVKCIKRFWARVGVGVSRMRSAAPQHTCPHAVVCRASARAVIATTELQIELVWCGCSFYFHERNKKRHEQTFEPEPERRLLWAIFIVRLTDFCVSSSSLSFSFSIIFMFMLRWCALPSSIASSMRATKKCPKAARLKQHERGSKWVATVHFRQMIWSRCAQSTQHFDVLRSAHFRCTRSIDVQHQAQQTILHFLSFVEDLTHQHKFGGHLFAYGLGWNDPESRPPIKSEMNFCTSNKRRKIMSWRIDCGTELFLFFFCSPLGPVVVRDAIIGMTTQRLSLYECIWIKSGAIPHHLISFSFIARVRLLLFFFFVDFSCHSGCAISVLSTKFFF